MSDIGDIFDSVKGAVGDAVRSPIVQTGAALAANYFFPGSGPFVSAGLKVAGDTVFAEENPDDAEFDAASFAAPAGGGGGGGLGFSSIGSALFGGSGGGGGGGGQDFSSIGNAITALFQGFSRELFPSINRGANELGGFRSDFRNAPFGALGGMDSSLRQFISVFLNQVLPKDAEHRAVLSLAINGFLGAGLPALGGMSNVFGSAGPNAFERLVAGTVVGPRQFGGSLVRSYYANPGAVESHLTYTRAAASESFLRAVARARET